MSDKLAALERVAVPDPLGRHTQELDLSDDEIEELARFEHDRWSSDLQRDGWRYTDGSKDPDRKLHPLLVPWEELSEEDREKDRDTIRALPRMLAAAGFTVVKVSEDRTREPVP